jgi:hypothetical protein
VASAYDRLPLGARRMFEAVPSHLSFALPLLVRSGFDSRIVMRVLLRRSKLLITYSELNQCRCAGALVSVALIVWNRWPCT